MEFTYEGLVRYGFGFTNPNHAAALITMLLPLLWTWRSLLKNHYSKFTVLAVESLLYVGLILTYSRTGFFVLIMSSLLFWGMKFYVIDKKQFKELAPELRLSKRNVVILIAVASIVVLAVSFKASNRYFAWLEKPGKSITNRFVIWQGAAQIIADNPSGTGMGRSGMIFSTFYCPPDANIECRTMVNSFLTFAVEHGIWLSATLLLLFIFVITLSILRLAEQDISRKRQLMILGLLTAIVAGGISGIMSTCFEYKVVYDLFRMSYETNTLINVCLQTALFALWSILPFALLFTTGISKRSPLIKSACGALIISSLIILAVVLSGIDRSRQITPCKVVKSNNTEFITIDNDNSSPCLLFIPDHNTLTLKSSLKLLKKLYPGYNYKIPLSLITPGIFTQPCDNLILCGKNSFWSNRINSNPIHLVLPQTTLNRLPDNVTTVILPRFDNNGQNPLWQELAEPSKQCKVLYY